MNLRHSAVAFVAPFIMIAGFQRLAGYALQMCSVEITCFATFRPSEKWAREIFYFRFSFCALGATFRPSEKWARESNRRLSSLSGPENGVLAARLRPLWRKLKCT